jgi:hypothetical protein
MENQLIYPNEASQVAYWTKRWSISASQLNEAILETGSLSVKDIRGYLLKNIHFSLKAFVQFIRFYI